MGSLCVCVCVSVYFEEHKRCKLCNPSGVTLHTEAKVCFGFEFINASNDGFLPKTSSKF